MKMIPHDIYFGADFDSTASEDEKCCLKIMRKAGARTTIRLESSKRYFAKAVGLGEYKKTKGKQPRLVFVYKGFF